MPTWCELVSCFAGPAQTMPVDPGCQLRVVKPAEKKGPRHRSGSFLSKAVTFYLAFAIFMSRSTVRQEYPHSLSYQETTLKNLFSPFRLFCMVARLS